MFGINLPQCASLQSVQNMAARMVCGVRRSEHITPVLEDLHCESKNCTLFKLNITFVNTVRFLSRVSILTHDTDIANLSVRLSVRPLRSGTG